MGTITVEGVEAYGGDLISSDSALTVDWGRLYVGSSKNVSFYLRSVSNVPITLTLNLDEWMPENIEPFIHVSWNYTGTQMAPAEEIFVRIDLNTSSSADFIDYLVNNQVTSFSFGLNIKALANANICLSPPLNKLDFCLNRSCKIGN